MLSDPRFSLLFFTEIKRKAWHAESIYVHQACTDQQYWKQVLDKELELGFGYWSCEPYHLIDQALACLRIWSDLIWSLIIVQCRGDWERAIGWGEIAVKGEANPDEKGLGRRGLFHLVVQASILYSLFPKLPVAVNESTLHLLDNDMMPWEIASELQYTVN